jgi:hypothetical protein
MRSIAVKVPLMFRKRGGGGWCDYDAGRRAAAAGRQCHGQGRWRGRSGGGRCWMTACYATIEDLARAKGVNVTYVSRILRLTYAGYRGGDP